MYVYTLGFNSLFLSYENYALYVYFHLMFIKQCYDFDVKFVLRISENKLLFLCCGLSVYTELSTSRFQEAMQVLNDILNIFQQQRDQSIPKVIYI